MNSKPLILLSNDDGVQAKGLHFLIETLRPLAHLFVMAPDGPRSGAGCSITSALPITYRILKKEEGLTVCACTGTPVDCVKLAFDVALEGRRPDLVVGGVNHGNNATINTHYSGTMGVAFEGAQQGVPSVAFSLCNHSDDADFTPLRPYVQRLTQKVLRQGLPEGGILNINFPDRPAFEGIRVCRMARSRWAHEYAPRQHPYGQPYYWLTGDCLSLETGADDTDSWALEHGYVAITPTTIDVTHYGLLNDLKNWTE